MRTFSKILGLGLFAAASAIPALHELDKYSFEDFVKEFQRDYTDKEEYSFRKGLFEGRLSMFRAHNAQPSNSWTMNVNKFTDMTDDEMAMFRGVNKGMSFSKSLSANALSHKRSGKALPASVDWREEGVITPVKNQASCGSCWAFSATETIESMWAIKTNELLELAPQELVDCVPNPNHCGGTGGCQGATMELGFDYIKTVGHALEKDYPYKAKNGACLSKPAAANVTGYVRIEENSYEGLMDALANVGPISITVAASAWPVYGGGVFDGCSKDADLNHGVQLVGYGTDPVDGDYWIVRNSWGEGWGEKGFMRLARHGGDWCGTDNTPKDGTGCDDAPDSVTVCGTCGILYDNSYPTV